MITTTAQAKRVIIAVFSVSALAGGGLLLHLLDYDLTRPERVLAVVGGSLLLLGGVLLMLSAIPGMPGPRRMLKIGGGFLLLMLGLLMSIPGVPGPGFLAILGALAILGGEFVWARKLLDRCKSGAERMKKAVLK